MHTYTSTFNSAYNKDTKTHYSFNSLPFKISLSLDKFSNYSLSKINKITACIPTRLNHSIFLPQAPPVLYFFSLTSTKEVNSSLKKPFIHSLKDPPVLENLVTPASSALLEPLFPPSYLCTSAHPSSLFCELDLNYPSNYRPISSLPFYLKTLKCLIVSQFSNFFNYINSSHLNEKPQEKP